MNKIFFNLLLLAVLMLGFSATQAWAQKPIKGNWTFNVTTPMGTLPVPVSFKKGGKGTVNGPTGLLTLSYRENGANVSICFEGPGLNPAGGDLTLVIRGTKTDTTITATGYAITDTPDSSSSVGFMVVNLPVAGTRM